MSSSPLRKAKSTLLLCILSFCPLVLAADTPTLTGKFSLQGSAPRTEGHLRVSAVGKDPLKLHLDLWMTMPSSPQPIRDYAIEMTKKLHVVVVSSDFAQFMHIHPILAPNGHFTIDQQFPAPGLYYLYADGLPDKLNHQVFRFNIKVGNPGAQKPMAVSPTGREVNVGPYTVDLSQVVVKAHETAIINLHILKGDKAATDLHPYLGANAHAVFLNDKDLSYVHVHPMSMEQMMAMGSKSGPMQMPPDLPENSISSPDLMLHVSIWEPGTYKMWLQFRGGDQLYAAPFILTAQ